MAPLISIAPARQASLFDLAAAPNTVALTPEVEAMLARHCAVAVGVSGGKDSQACALAVAKHLDSIGHQGPRVLIHSHLGVVEWQASLPTCQRLAEHMGWELMVTERKAGGLMERWETRWRNNVERYRELKCVKLILPWSSSAMRFCTSELKSAPIASALRKRWPGLPILNVTGIRREESPNRSRMPVSEVDVRLERKKAGADGVGLIWNAIIEWPLDAVFSYVAEHGLDLHEAYTRYGTSRVSCVFCILARRSDLRAATTCVENRGVYVRMVELEAASTFSMQSNHWLADVAPELLGDELRQRIEQAKVAAKVREAAEKLIPKHMLFTKGWPNHLPTQGEADLIAEVRQRVSQAVGIEANYLTGDQVRERYAVLYAECHGSLPFPEQVAA